MRSDTKWEERPAASGLSMKIYFCDVCNESIPLKDINSNRITIEDGKIICPKCAPKAAKKRATMPGGLLPLFTAMFVGLAALAILGAVQISKLSGEIGTLQDRLDSKVSLDAGQSQAQATLNRKLQNAEKQLAGAIGDLKLHTKDVNKQISQLRDAKEENSEEIRAVRENELKSIRDRLEARRDALDESITNLKMRQTALDTVFEEYRRNTKDNLTRLEVLIRSGMPVAGGAVGPVTSDGKAKGPGSSKMDKEVTELIAQLSDPNDGVRFTATADLGNHTGERVVLALEKMLEDPVDFVRKMAIRSLKKLRSVRSVPLIIQALRDEDAYTRKAAMAALRVITEQNFGFEHEASAKQRESKVKEWERWWAANRAKLLREK